MAHLHWIVWAATDRVEQNFTGITYVDVIAESAHEAIAKAKTICHGLEPPKRHYWVNNVVEHHAHDPFSHQEP